MKIFVIAIIGAALLAAAPWSRAQTNGPGTTEGGGTNDEGTLFALSLGPVLEPIPLTIALVNLGLILTWSNPAFSLQAAPTINGVFTNVPGATSPYTNSMIGPAQFFRLMVN